MRVLAAGPRVIEELVMSHVYRTLRIAPSDDGVLGVAIDAPPMNLIGPELVRDLVTLLSELESDEDIRVMVLESADPEYFVPHVDLTRVAEYTAEAAKAGGPDDASLGMLWHKLSELPAIPHHRRKEVVVGRSVNDPIDWLVNTHPRKECSCLRQLLPMLALSPSYSCMARLPMLLVGME